MALLPSWDKIYKLWNLSAAIQIISVQRIQQKEVNNFCTFSDEGSPTILRNAPFFKEKEYSFCIIRVCVRTRARVCGFDKTWPHIGRIYTKCICWKCPFAHVEMRCHLLTVTVYLFYNAATRYIGVPSVIHSDEISSTRPQCQLNRRCLCRTLLHIGRMTDHLSLILLHLTCCCRLRHLDQSLSAALGILLQGLLSAVYPFFFLYYVLPSYLYSSFLPSYTAVCLSFSVCLLPSVFLFSDTWNLSDFGSVTLTGCCDRGNELSGSATGGNIFDQLTD